MLDVTFVFFLILAGYSYFIYPLILALVLAVRKDRIKIPQVLSGEPPDLTLIVTVYNESQRIEAKLEDTLKLDYPAGKLQVIFASDCSDDGTDEIIRQFSDRGIELVRADQRLGKEYAQKCAIEAAKGSILVFSDVATQLPEDAILKLVRYYEEPQVGAVSSEDRFISQSGEIAGEGLYVKYEMWLRQLESQTAGLVGLSGSFFSCRREVAVEWDIYSPSDFNTAINCAKLGLKAVTAKDVLGYYRDLSDPAREYQRKVRTVLRGMTGLARHAETMNPLKYGLFAFQMASHKLMRWSVPVFMFFTLLLNILLLGHHWFYNILFLAQALFYGSGILYRFLPMLQNFTPARVIYFFLQVNAAITHSMWLFLKGQRMTVWQPSQR